MHRHFQDRDERMKELSGGKTLKVAAVPESSAATKKDKTTQKKKDPPQPQLAPVTAPSKGEKGDTSNRDNKGTRKG